MRLNPPKHNGTSTEFLVIHTDPEQGASSPLTPPKHNNHNKSNPHTRQKQRLSGWRFTLTLAFLACLIVFALNLGFVLWTVRHENENNQARGVLYEGPCSKVKRLGIGLHFVINILSTVLLAASNYCMQCLSAPTRKDTDQVHPRAYWLDIGVPSVRNVFYIPKRRAFLWLLMNLSSLPLHLIYNSTIFSTISTNSYVVFAGSESFGKQNLTSLSFEQSHDQNVVSSFLRLHEKAQGGLLTELDPLRCVDAYATTFQRVRGSLVLVTDDVGDGDTNHYKVVSVQDVLDPHDHASKQPAQADPYKWVCSQFTNAAHDCVYYVPRIKNQAANGTWNVVAHPDTENSTTLRVKKCLSEESPEHCRLQYSLELTVVVIVFNAVKALILVYVVVGSVVEDPILTVGDAVASYIRRPDRATQGGCLVPRRFTEVYSYTRESRYHKPVAFVERPRRWCSAVSARRWIFTIFFYALSIIICLSLLAYALTQRDTTRAIWTAGLQALEIQTLITGETWPTSLTPNTIVANTPQLIYSILYFALNALLTRMTLAAEWSSYAVERKGLRVSSHPARAQRSNYFLSLPYRYIIPLLTTSAVLHWLISQSLFLVGVDAYSPRQERDPEGDIITCGYSPAAIVSAVAVGTAMVCCVGGLGCKRLRSGMPVAGSCSLGIAAACHPTSPGGCGLEDAEYLPLKWGCVSVEDYEGGGYVGHCAFSSEEVEMPRDGGVYR